MIRYDSTGKVIQIGDTVKFKRKYYTIQKFNLGKGKLGTATIEFKESAGRRLIVDELDVDLVERGAREVSSTSQLFPQLNIVSNNPEK